MDYQTLLLYLENQLKWLQKKDCHYLNQESLPKVELCELIDGLYELVPHNAGDSGKELNFAELSVSEKNAVSLQNLKQKLAISCAQANEEITNAQDIDSCPPSSKVPVFREPEPTQIFQNDHRSQFKGETLSDLCKQNSECQRCALGPTRNQFVFGSGNAGSLLMFVGEGPGADEDRLGLPFVGKAGKLLDRMIDVIGLDREDVYVTNVVKCRPPNNRNPTPDEIAHCIGMLRISQRIWAIHLCGHGSNRARVGSIRTKRALSCHQRKEPTPRVVTIVKNRVASPARPAFIVQAIFPFGRL